jgi:hypothetical protein
MEKQLDSTPRQAAMTEAPAILHSPWQRQRSALSSPIPGFATLDESK